MVQFAKKLDAEKLVKKWNDGILKDARVRMTNPPSLNVGIIRNGPVTFSIDDIFKDLQLQYTMSACLHLKVNNMPTTTIIK